MDELSLSGISPLLLSANLGRTRLAPLTGQFVCINGTLTRLLTIQLVDIPRVSDVALTGTGFGIVLLSTANPEVRRTMRALVGQPVTLCGFTRIARGAGGMLTQVLDVVIVIPTSTSPRPILSRSLLHTLMFLLLSNTAGLGSAGLPLGIGLLGLGGLPLGLANNGSEDLGVLPSAGLFNLHNHGGS